MIAEKARRMARGQSVRCYVREKVNFYPDTRKEFIDDINKHVGQMITAEYQGSTWKITGMDGAPSGSGYWNVSNNKMDTYFTEEPPSYFKEDLFAI